MSKSKFAVVLRLALCLCLALCLIPAGRALAQEYAMPSYNQNDQNYNTWGRVITSYLVPNSYGTFTRVESIDDEVRVENFSSEYGFINGFTIENELPLFGGFYSGTNYNFLVFGQTNYAESDSVEVIRIVRYTKDWERCGSASLYGANTTKPFEAGSLRFAEYGSYLYIRTAHEMYTSSDGLNHQANLTLNVRTSDMVITDSFHKVWNVAGGYVSHSFNQFIAIDNGQIVTVDHGDAYPRSVVLMRYAAAAGQDRFTSSTAYVDVLSINGAIGANATGVSVGGFEVSDSNYLIAGNTASQGSDYNPYGQRNIFVSATSRNFFSASGTAFRYLTNYTSGDNVTVSTPHLVPVGPDRYMVLWTEGAASLGNLRYTYVDSYGCQSSQVYTGSARLSDCRPVVSGGKLVWYVTSDSTPCFYAIDLATNEVSTYYSVTYNANLGQTAPGNQVKQSGRDLVITSEKPVREGYIFMGWGLGPYSSTATYQPGDTYSDDLSRVLYAIWTKKLETPKITKLENTADGIRITWDPVENPKYYRVYQKTAKGWKVLGTTMETSWLFTDVTNGGKYTFTVRCFNWDETTAISDYNRTGWSKTFVSQPKINKLENTASGIKLTWGAVKGAAGYRVYVKTSTGWKAVATVTGNSYTYTAAKSGTAYRFTIRCVDKNGKVTSSYNATGWRKTYVARPAISKLENTVSGIKLTWAKVPGAADYRVYVKTASGWKALDTVTGSCYTYTAAKSGTAYRFTIRCVDKNGKVISSYNDTGWRKTYVAQPGLKPMETTEQGIKLTWNKVTGAAQYRVYLKTSAGWKALATTTGTTYTYRQVVAGKTYTFTVRALDKAGNAVSSYRAAGWSHKYVSQPALYSLRNTTEGLRMAWNAVAGADRYWVFVKTSSGWKRVGETTGTEFVFTGAEKGKTYVFTVRCVSADNSVFTSAYNTSGWSIRRK